jgi:DNA-binding MarR family transcriptional regulator
MVPRSVRLYLKPDWLVWGELGGDVVLVDVATGSPAWLAEIRNGTWVELMNEMTFRAFEATKPRVGTLVAVKAFRIGLGHMRTTLTLAERPKVRRPPRTACRARVARVECGRLITRDDRPKWLTELAEKVQLSQVARTIGSFLCNRAINDVGFTDRWSIDAIAKRIGASRSTVHRGIDELSRAGLIRVQSGRRSRRNNQYVLTWPQTSAETNLIPFKSRSA